MYTQSIATCLDYLIQIKGRKLLIGTPLGIGKPNQLLNAIWEKAKSEPDLSLEIFTALSLQIPRGKSILEKRFLQPFTKRFFADYPELQYINDVKKDNLPANIKLTEFYMQSGKMLKSPSAQKNYTSSNYTHAARDMVDKGINVIMQMVSVKKSSDGFTYSLSCNPDLTLDILNICDKKQLEKPCVIGVLNPHLPFMGGQAEVTADFFDVLLDDEKLYFAPFATPMQAINHTDYSIGLLTSTLLQDGGTLQVGIGSLADALVYCTKLRQQHNQGYRTLLKELAIIPKFSQIIDKIGSLETYKQGLYAASEMFVEGFAHLYDAGILKRKVYPNANIQSLINNNKLTETLAVDVVNILLKHEVLEEIVTKKQMLDMQSIGVFKADLTMHKGFMQDAQGRKFSTNLESPENIEALQKNCIGKQLLNGSVLHSAFFLGSKWFYQWLRDLSDQDRALFQMTPVSQVNELYGGEVLDRVQRIKARFVNTCMKVDLLGAAASDGLNNHQMVSGVGGQYNFVAMAHALEDSRSILMLRSTHSNKGKIESNVVWKYSYCTIPRHLRDVVVTEYGIADLRGQTDEECIKRMICIADSRFQAELRSTAIKYHKLDVNWLIPDAFRSNTAESQKQNFQTASSAGYFPEYPFSCDFTDQELVIIRALKFLKANTTSKTTTIKIILSALFFSRKTTETEGFLKRMDLNQTSSFKEKLAQKLLLFALQKTT